MMTPDPTIAEPATEGTRSQRFWALMRRLGPVGPVAIISMTLPAVMGILLVLACKWYETPLKEFAAARPMLALATYVVGFAILAGFPVLPTYSVSFLGGYIFKVQMGFAASLAGYTGAAMVSYVFLHLLSGNRVENIIDEHPKWRAVRNELLARSTWRTLGIVALLRLPPNLPFAVVNLVIVTARIGLGVYFVGTMLGVVPRTLVVVYIAAAASNLGEAGASVGWLTIGGIAVAVVVLGVITHLAHNAIRAMASAPVAPRSFPAEPPP